jgi:hypothetical protein
MGFDARRPVSNPIDARELPDQYALPHPIPHLRRTDPCAQQLVAIDDPVRASGHLRESSLYRPILVVHITT